MQSVRKQINSCATIVVRTAYDRISNFTENWLSEALLEWISVSYKYVLGLMLVVLVY